MIRQVPPRWFISTGKTQRAASTLDSGGGVINTYSDYIASLPMRFNTQGGSERLGNRVNGSNSYTIYVNGNPAPDIVEKDRIVYSNRVFDVVAVNNMDEAGVFLTLTAEEVFPSSPSSLLVDFTTFNLGNVNGQQGWGGTSSSSAQISSIMSGRAVKFTSGVTFSPLVPAFTAFNPAVPWELNAQVAYVPVPDLGGTATISVTNNEVQYANVNLTFASGDGALNRCGTVSSNDTNGGATTGGPASFPASSYRTVTFQYNGTRLFVLIDGTTVVTRTTTAMSGVGNGISITGQVTSGSDAIAIQSINLSNT